MNVQLLIDAIVRQTTVLIAQLATRGGVRAPLAHLANQVFLELAKELQAQGAADSALYVSDAYPGTSGSLRCSIEGHLCNGTKPPLTAFSTPFANCLANPAPTGLLSVSELVADVKARKPQGAIEVMVVAGVSLQGTTTPPYAFNTPALAAPVLDAEPACAASKGSATPALRLGAFADAFGGSVRSICEPTFDNAMTVIAAGRN